MKEVGLELIEKTLQKHNNNRKAAAKELGISERTIYRKIADALVDDGVILYHGSVIAVDGQGYLFTAKSGTGKSTHTALWRELFGERAVMVNDDKPLLRVKDDQVTVYGTPWNGNRLSDPVKMFRTMDILGQLLRCVPIYRLKCNMDIEAAKVSYEGMQ